MQLFMKIFNLSAPNKTVMSKDEARVLAYCPADHCNTLTSMIQMSANTEVLFTKYMMTVIHLLEIFVLLKSDGQPNFASASTWRGHVGRQAAPSCSHSLPGTWRASSTRGTSTPSALFWSYDITAWKPPQGCASPRQLVGNEPARIYIHINNL